MHIQEIIHFMIISDSPALSSEGSLKKLTALKVDENQLMYLPDSVGG